MKIRQIAKALQARTLSDKIAAVTKAEEERSRVEPIADQSPMNIRYLGSLQIAIRLTPSIFVDDIGERHTANWPKLSHRIADRQQSIGVDVRRQPECNLRFLLELQVQRCQSRAKAECPRREQRVLEGDQSRV